MRDMLPPTNRGSWPDPAEDPRDRDLPEPEQPDARRDEQDARLPHEDPGSGGRDEPEIRWPEDDVPDERA